MSPHPRSFSLGLVLLALVLAQGCGSNAPAASPEDVREDAADVPMPDAGDTVEPGDITDANDADDMRDADPDVSTDAPGDVDVADRDDDDVRDVPDDADANDSGDDEEGTPAENACGGTTELRHGGLPAEPGDACGPCDDGTLVCGADRESLVCDEASERNACEGCGELPGEIDTLCDTCALWVCSGTSLLCVPTTTLPGCEEEPVLTCDDLRCEDEGRTCVEEDGHSARCGVCLPGLVDADGLCEAPDDQLATPEDLRVEQRGLTSVTLRWDPVEGAVAYRIYRDDVPLGDPVADTLYVDATAGPAQVPAPAGFTASRETRTDAIELSWSAVVVTPAPRYIYRVRALAEGELVDSALSAPLEAGALTPSLTGYRLERQGWSRVVTATTYVDTEAPRPPFRVGTVTATEGTRTDGVEVRAQGAGFDLDALVPYTLRALTDAEEGGVSQAEGRVRPGASPRTWERSVGTEPTSFTTLSTFGSGEGGVDEDAPLNGAHRWYRACYRLAPDDRPCTEPALGFRDAGQPILFNEGISNVQPRGFTVSARLSSVGNPPAHTVGFCLRAGAAAENCEPTTLAAGNRFEMTYTLLNPGTTYHVRPYAQTTLGRTYGVSASITLVPAAPLGVVVDGSTRPDALIVRWQAVAGAQSYSVFRGGTLVAEGLTTTSFVDTDVSPGELTTQGMDLRGGVPGAGRNRLVWDIPSSLPGPSYTYEVLAFGASGPSARSAPAEGRLDGPVVSGFEVRVGEGPWLTLGPVTSFVHNTPPRPTIEAGMITFQTDPVLGHVRLGLDGYALRPGAAVTYRVRPINAVLGAGPALSIELAAQASAPRFAWERSTNNQPDSFVPLDATSQPTFLDRFPDTSGEARWYRSRITAEGADEAIAGPGRYLPPRDLPVASSLVLTTGTAGELIARANLTFLGQPEPQLLLFCWEALDEGAEGRQAEGCEAAFFQSTFVVETRIGELFPAMRYRVGLVAIYEEERFVLIDDTVRAGLAAPASFSASIETFLDRIELTWASVPFAEAYELLRNGTVIAQLGADDLSYVDRAVPRGQFDPGSFSFQASRGTFEDYVLLNWSGPFASPGQSVSYTIRALIDDLVSPNLVAFGSTGAPVVERYLLTREEAEAVEVTGGTLEDRAAPPAPIIAGALNASQGTLQDGVLLSLANIQYGTGTVVRYQLRAHTNDGNVFASGVREGYRGGRPAIEFYRWQRALVQEGPFIDLEETEAPDYLDTSAPLAGSTRYYRVQVLDGEGNVVYTSNVASGRRRLIQPVVSLLASSDSDSVIEGGLSITNEGTATLLETRVCLHPSEVENLDLATCERFPYREAGVPVPNRVARFTALPANRAYVMTWETTYQGDPDEIRRSRGPWTPVKTRLPRPTGLQATQGTLADRVEVRWDPVPEATTYRLLRNGNLLASNLTQTTYDDTTAPALPTGQAPDNFRLTAAEFIEGLRMEWILPAPPVGQQTTYSVIALVEGNSSVESQGVTGWTGVVGREIALQVAIDASPFADLDPGLMQPVDGLPGGRVWIDLSAPAGTTRITSFTVERVAGEEDDGMGAIETVSSLEYRATIELTPGPLRSYRLRMRYGDDVFGQPTNLVSGQRNGGDTRFRWYYAPDGQAASLFRQTGAGLLVVSEADFPDTCQPLPFYVIADTINNTEARSATRAESLCPPDTGP